MENSLATLRWSARLLCVLSILFVSFFALDAFDKRFTLWQQLSDFLIHIVPSLILVGMLIVAWKWELLGGVIFITASLILAPIIFKLNYDMNHSASTSAAIILLIVAPFFFCGVLFVLSFFFSKY